MHWLKKYIRHHQLVDWISKNPAAFCACVVITWTFAGLTGHDPWKPDEAHTFGITYSVIKDSNWIVPTLANELYMKSPALVYIVSAITAMFFEPVFALHDGARLSTGFWMLIVFGFAALSARELWGGRSTWLAPTILAGCVGLLVRGHQLTNSVILLASMSIAIYGLAVAPRRHIVGGLALGIGGGLSCLATGLVDLIMIITITTGMIVISPIYRTKRFIISLIIALSLAIPIGAVWPTLLYQANDQIFFMWLYSENALRLKEIFTISANDDFLYYLKIILWFSWPAWPLSLWALWIARGHGLYRREVQLPIVAFCGIFIFLSISGEGREIHALPLLLPMSLLASNGFQRVPRGAINAFYWFSIMIVTVFIILCWILFSAIQYQSPDWLVRNTPTIAILQGAPSYPWQIFGGLMISILWIFLLLNLKRFPERPAIVWTTGVTVGWILAVMLLFPWIDYVKTYKYMVYDLKKSLPSPTKCITRYGIGEPQRAMLDYFGGITTSPMDGNPKSQTCELVLIRGDLKGTGLPIDNWKQLWKGSRHNDNNEIYGLYKRVDELVFLPKNSQ